MIHFKPCEPGYDDPMRPCEFGPESRGERYCHVHHDYDSRPYTTGRCPHADELLTARRRGERTVARCACNDRREAS